MYTNIDIFLSSAIAKPLMIYPPIIYQLELSLQLHRTAKRTKMTKHTNWTHAKFCNKININPHLTNETHMDTEIKTLTQHIEKAYRNAIRTVSTYNISPNGLDDNISPITDPLLLDIIENQNRMRRKYQKTGNTIFKLHRNNRKNKIQKKNNTHKKQHMATKTS